MKLENQVCKLEQAKRLIELGVEHKSLFHHFQGEVVSEAWGNDYHPAFTVSELAPALKQHMPYWVAIWGEWGYKDCRGAGRGYENLAVACAECLIDMLENNLTTAEEVNQRLFNN